MRDRLRFGSLLDKANEHLEEAEKAASRNSVQEEQGQVDLARGYLELASLVQSLNLNEGNGA